MQKRARYSQLHLLEHIIELCETINKELTGKVFEDFQSDRNLVDATAFRLQAIGEACTKLEDRIKAAHDLPWKEIIGMRQVLSHNYMGLSKVTVWRTAIGDLGELHAACAIAAAVERGRT
ncbi:MAG: HepT-like ribonuclease domain-containing protein [Parvularculaceae bacterium]